MAQIDISTEELSDLLKSIADSYGYDFNDYAALSVKRRINHFMAMHQFKTLASLKDNLLLNKHFFEKFIHEIPVTVTEMFRDPTFYKNLRQRVVKRLATYPILKIWIAGCATGEEAYSLAIMLKEEGLLNRSTIYATDINHHSLETAKQGSYPLQQMKCYTDNYIQSEGKATFSDYYTVNYTEVKFEESLSKNIVFSSHNLVSDKSFNEFQLIICRNVLIYFNTDLQNKVINLLYDSLCQFGFLALGNKESLLFMKRKTYFEEIDKREKIYMKNK